MIRAIPLGARLKQASARTLWYAREFTGENAYTRYLEHHRATHPDAEPLTRNAFERSRTDRRDADPRESGSCC
ncbi:YbdD/YjiX family protein [Streptomyces sp. NPDC102384]|uniref:YbdD/YjiX family protein n=1 Tax=Streptomyces sp. NPDC102384 TaxID=3366166 RepID=UPI0037F4AAE5